MGNFNKEKSHLHFSVFKQSSLNWVSRDFPTSCSSFFFKLPFLFACNDRVVGLMAGRLVCSLVGCLFGLLAGLLASWFNITNWMVWYESAFFSYREFSGKGWWIKGGKLWRKPRWSAFLLSPFPTSPCSHISNLPLVVSCALSRLVWAQMETGKVPMATHTWPVRLKKSFFLTQNCLIHKSCIICLICSKVDFHMDWM